MRTFPTRMIAALALALVPAGFASADERIRILGPTWSGFAPVLVAEDLGYFKAQGIEVSLKFEDDRPNVMAAMARGDIEVDMRTVGEYQGRPRDETTPGVIIGTIDQSLGGDGVVAAGDIRSVADLKGRNVASEANIPARLLLQLALKRHGMSLEDLHLKEIATADTVPIFADGSIAAVASYEPFVSQAVKNDGARQPHVLLSSRDYPGMIVDVLAVRREDLAANPAKYRKLLIGIYKATAFFQADPAGFIRLAAPHYDISEADFRASIDGTLSYTPLDWAAAALGKPGAPGTLYGVFDQVMALNLENGAASTKLDAATSIDNSVIATIGPADLE